MAARSAEAVWNGTLQEGNGNIKLASGAFEGQYSFSSRFEEGTGTNPEELIAAAHAGCFSMQIGATLGRQGFAPKSIATTAKVEMQRVNDVPTITKIVLEAVAEVPDIDEAKFMEVANDAKENCIISRALAGVETIELKVTLNN